MIPTMKIGKKIEKSLCMILWMFEMLQTKILANHLNQRLSKYTKKKEKRSSNHCCQAYIVSGLYFYTYFKIVVEISKNFSKGIPYVSWIFENCYHVSDNKFNT